MSGHLSYSLCDPVYDLTSILKTFISMVNIFDTTLFILIRKRIKVLKIHLQQFVLLDENVAIFFYTILYVINILKVINVLCMLRTNYKLRHDIADIILL